MTDAEKLEAAEARVDALQLKLDELKAAGGSYGYFKTAEAKADALQWERDSAVKQFQAAEADAQTATARADALAAQLDEFKAQLLALVTQWRTAGIAQRRESVSFDDWHSGIARGRDLCADDLAALLAPK